MTGTIGWYRKDFRLPSAERDARLGDPLRVGQLPREGLAQRSPDRPPHRRLPALRGAPARRCCAAASTGSSCASTTAASRPTSRPRRLAADGVPTGGWWNYGGLLREVYLRKIDRVDFNSVQVRPNLPCATCAATVDVHGRRSATTRAKAQTRAPDRALRRAHGQPRHARSIGPGGFATLHAAAARSTSPRLWSPAAPYLYDASLTARVGRARSAAVAGYTLRSGIRSIKVVTRRAADPQRPVRATSAASGCTRTTRCSASRSPTRSARQYIAGGPATLGATLIRAHYPLHPYIQELADRYGILLWSEIPVYTVKTQYLKRALVRRLAVQELQDNIRANQNHPSVIMWSIGNELLAPAPGRCRATTSARAARGGQAARPDAAGRRSPSPAIPSAGCQTRVRAARRASGSTTTSAGTRAPAARSPTATLLLAYLDSAARVLSGQGDRRHRVRRRGQPRRAARGEGHATQFQQDFVNYHLGVFATKPWLVGRDLLDAQGVPRAPRLGRRQPAPGRRRCTRRA